MKARLSILFYGKKTKHDAKKTLTIYLRVTINGQRLEVSTHRYVDRVKWSASAGKVKGSSEEARTINQYLDGLRQMVYDYQKNASFRKENYLPKIPYDWPGLELNNGPIH